MSRILSHALPASFLSLIAHDLRWRTLTALAHSDYKVQELVLLLGESQNLISYHLKRLREVRLVTEHRSNADGRDIYYSVDLERFRQLYFLAAESLHPALAPHEIENRQMAKDVPPTKVLFLCTHNSARSQLAEALMRHYGGNTVEVYSAGSSPSKIHPDAVWVMAAMGVDISGQRSKSLDEFVGQQFDYIVTVCDKVREICPYFPGDPEQIHWSFSDPAAIEGEEERLAAFRRTAQELTIRLRFLLGLIENERRRKGSED